VQINEIVKENITKMFKKIYVYSEITKVKKGKKYKLYFKLLKYNIETLID